MSRSIQHEVRFTDDHRWWLWWCVVMVSGLVLVSAIDGCRLSDHRRRIEALEAKAAPLTVEEQDGH